MIQRPEFYSYVVSCRKTAGFPLDMLRFAQAHPATTESAMTIHRLIVAEETGDYRALPDGDVSVHLSTAIPTSGAAFADYVKRWQSFGFKVLIHDHAYDEIGAYDPERVRYYGVR